MGIRTRKCITTGVLNRNENTGVIRLTFTNLGTEIQQIFVNIYSWDDGTPNLLDNFRVDLNPSTNFTNNSFVPVNVHLYEVRMDIPNKESVTVNAFGVSDEETFDQNQEGNTVLFNDFITIALEDCNLVPPAIQRRNKKR